MTKLMVTMLVLVAGVAMADGPQPFGPGGVPVPRAELPPRPPEPRQPGVALIQYQMGQVIVTHPSVPAVGVEDGAWVWRQSSINGDTVAVGLKPDPMGGWMVRSAAVYANYTVYVDPVKWVPGESVYAGKLKTFDCPSVTVDMSVTIICGSAAGGNNPVPPIPVGN